MYIGLHVKYPLYLSDFNETRLLTDFEKYSSIKFHENPSIGRRRLPCERTGGRAGAVDMTKLTVAYRNFANAPNK